ALADLLRSRPAQKLVEERALAAFPAFAARFDLFLADHGHREVDFDPYHPTWVEAPWLVLESLRLMIEGPPGENPEERLLAQRRRAQQAELALLTPLPEDLRFFAGELVRLVRAYTALDDIEHYQTARLTLPLRRAMKALGSRLLAEGVGEEPLDLFFA